MSFSNLPPELVLFIAGTLHSTQDINALIKVSRGLYHLLKKYLYQYNVDYESSCGLGHAVKTGNLSATCYFLSLPRVNVHVRDDAGQTILHAAAQRPDGFYIMMILLRDGRVDINATDFQGRTPVSYAVSNDDLRQLSLLLRRDDININMSDVEDRAPFYFAVDYGNKDIVKRLLDDARLDPNMSTGSLSPLALAAGWSSLELLEMLLRDQRVIVNNQTYRRMHPLIAAVVAGHEENTIRLLHTPNIDVNCCWAAMSVLMWTIPFKQTKIAAELLKCDLIDVNRQDDSGRTPLMVAIQYENHEVFTTLLNRGEIVLTLESRSGKSALDYAMESNSSRMVDDIRERLSLTS